MKTKEYNYGNLEYLNPWKAYKVGLVPLGLVKAYKNRWGCDLLKFSRLYSWLEHLRTISWQLLSFVIAYVSYVGIALDDTQRRNQFNSSGFSFILICGAIAIVILGLSWETNIKMRLSVSQIQRNLKYFMLGFQDVFETKSPSEFTDIMSLEKAVTEKMVVVAKTILQQEVISIDCAENQRYSLEELSTAANDVGLGRSWDTYFEEARKSLDTYACFTWEI